MVVVMIADPRETIRTDYQTNELNHWHPKNELLLWANTDWVLFFLDDSVGCKTVRNHRFVSDTTEWNRGGNVKNFCGCTEESSVSNEMTWPTWDSYPCVAPLKAKHASDRVRLEFRLYGQEWDFGSEPADLLFLSSRSQSVVLLSAGETYPLSQLL